MVFMQRLHVYTFSINNFRYVFFDFFKQTYAHIKTISHLQTSYSVELHLVNTTNIVIPNNQQSILSSVVWNCTIQAILMCLIYLSFAKEYVLHSQNSWLTYKCYRNITQLRLITHGMCTHILGISHSIVIQMMFSTNKSIICTIKHY